VVESGRFDWAKDGKFPSLSEPEPAYHGLKFYENFGDFAFTTKARPWRCAISGRRWRR
jgi:O-acetylhomoserine (thiol)-lyase